MVTTSFDKLRMNGSGRRRRVPATEPSAYGTFMAGKRVVLVGPAAYLEGQGRGEWIDSFDVVVRVNWGEALARDNPADYGSRTDVLYKRLLKLGKVEALDVAEYERQGLRWLVAIDVATVTQSVQHAQEMLEGSSVEWFLDTRTRGHLRVQMRTSPLIGVIAADHLMTQPLASLTLTGFDLYESGYGEGYGGTAYRQSMGRESASIGPTHDASKNLAWLVKLRDQDGRLGFDERLTELTSLPSPLPLRGDRGQARPAPATRLERRYGALARGAREESEYLGWLAGKRVIIVGPAAYMTGSGLGGWIDSHDVIVRMNLGSPVPEGLKADVGSRTDVLYFTRYTEAHRRANGVGHSPELTQAWLADGVKWAVSRHPYQRTKGFAATAGGLAWTSVGDMREDLRKVMGPGSGCNTGVIALTHVLMSKAASVQVVGCDFHTTGYMAGYGGFDAARAAEGLAEGIFYREISQQGARDYERQILPQLRYLAEVRERDTRVSYDERLTRLIRRETGPMAGVVAIVPARWGSSRLPGKPLIDLCGRPMVVWTCMAVEAALDRVIVATDDERIAAVVREAGYEALMTGPALTGTDRVAEVARQVEASIYLDVQGDEPLMEPADILRVLEAKRQHPEAVCTAMRRLETDASAPSVVKAAVAEDGRLLYVSRLPVPGNKAGNLLPSPPSFEGEGTWRGYWKHLGIYAFSREQLMRFADFGRRAAVEEMEDIELLRFLELGIPVRMVEVTGSDHSVDVPEDVPYVEGLLRERLAAPALAGRKG